jgi:hypothetical protein
MDGHLRQAAVPEENHGSAPVLFRRVLEDTGKHCYLIGLRGWPQSQKSSSAHARIEMLEQGSGQFWMPPGDLCHSIAFTLGYRQEKTLRLGTWGPAHLQKGFGGRPARETAGMG